MPDPTGKENETIDGKVLARSGMQVYWRLGGVMKRESRGLLSSIIHVGGILVGRRLGWVMGKYSRGLFSSAVLEGRPR